MATCELLDVFGETLVVGFSKGCIEKELRRNLLVCFIEKSLIIL
jgi:hypothetical protein